ncbi:hypothetical protein H3Z83_11195 [Tenacibaculum sp. S7007]|uniref:Multidrug transporter n=1 Tax=Tenacibaculum pelagium TaxID=2759527 RepID=A0A839AS24_9FLAO|nr:hypothetical protein [Tenacibaculum pelagium]MBA6157079.1 hypothetical protein [Tenacibaculum pelagium]
MKKLIALFITALTITSCIQVDENVVGTDGGSTGTNIDPTNFQGRISNETTTLDATKEYNLTGPFIIQDGARLVIPAGTVIKASGGTSSYIAVAQGGQIDVNGTSSNPVVMTSASSTPAPGDWGGLVICGKAPTNKGGSNGETATAEVSDLTYGGSIANDSSGSIRYLRVEYTGATFNGSKEFNGVSLFAVGSGTTFEYVQSYNGGDDGIEFFGGTVNGRYLVSTGSGDDSIDFADGWSGTGEYWYINKGTKAGIEGSNNGDNGNAEPKTTATLRNISIVGPGTEGAMYIKEGGGNWTVENVYVADFDLGIKLKDTDAPAIQSITDGNITFNPIQFDNITTKDQYTGAASYITEGNNTGAGNGKNAPTWAAGWTKGL